MNHRLTMERVTFAASTTMRAALFAAAMLACTFVTVDAMAQEPCTNAGECQSGFCVDEVCCDTECTGTCQGCSALVKGGGDDGECGQAAVGAVCAPSSCQSPGPFFVLADTCDANGNCVDNGEMDCVQSGGGCSFDLCHDINGCEVVLAMDGTPCGDDMGCMDGVCGMTTSSSGGGMLGTGGDDGGSGGSTGSGFGGAGGTIEAGSTDVNTACACGAVGGADGSPRTLWLLAIGAVVATRRRWSQTRRLKVP